MSNSANTAMSGLNGASNVDGSGGGGGGRGGDASSSERKIKIQESKILAVEIEMVADALDASDPTLRVEGDFVTGDPDVYGPEPPRVPLEDVRRILELKRAAGAGSGPSSEVGVGGTGGVGGGSGAVTPDRPLPSVPSHPHSQTYPHLHHPHHRSHLDLAGDAEWVGSRSASPLPPLPPSPLPNTNTNAQGAHSQESSSNSSSPPVELEQVVVEVPMERTLVATLHIVFPQHANTVGASSYPSCIVFVLGIDLLIV